MTLVLSCRTPDHVVLVSDRRVTRSDNGKIVDDARNKGINFEGRFAVGYSGLANIGKLPTDDWISVALANAEERHPFDYLTMVASNDLGRLPIPAARRHLAIIGVGWMRDAQGQDVPTQFIVSNAIKQQDWSWQPEASDQFVCYERILRRPEQSSSEWAFGVPIGARPDNRILRALFKNLSLAVRRQLSPVSVARFLAEAIRAVAKGNTSVGTNLVVLIVPRPTGNKGARMTTDIERIGSPPANLTDSVCYLLADGSLNFEWAMPNFVTNGWAFTDVSSGWNGSKRFIKARIRREGHGSAGVAIKFADDMEVRVETNKDGAVQQRVIRPGKPDEVSSTKGRTYTRDEVFGNPDRR